MHVYIMYFVMGPLRAVFGLWSSEKVHFRLGVQVEMQRVIVVRLQCWM